MKILICLSNLTEYMVTYLREIQSSDNSFLCFYLGEDQDNPLTDLKNAEEEFGNMLLNVQKLSSKEIWKNVQKFQPDLALTGGWNHSPYKKLHKKRNYISILAMDNQWFGTFKQRGGQIFAQILIKPYFDGVLVPGSSQLKFAQKLGFKKERIFKNLFPINRRVFSDPPMIRERNKEFLFVGRLVSEKNIELLAESYLEYRKAVENPWDLKIVGVGPLLNKIEHLPGVKLLGHLSHEKLVEEYRRCSCLVIPSRFEPWGIVVQEAASQGLAIISSNAVGSRFDLINHLKSGFILNECNLKQMTEALLHMHLLSKDEIFEYFKESLKLSQKYEQSTFTDNLTSIYRALENEN